MYGSGIKTLDGIAGDLEGNSQSTFSHLNSEVSNHSSAVEDVSINLYVLAFSFLLPITVFDFVYHQLFKGIASEADELLNDLQSNLHKQEEKLSAHAQQQREVCNTLFLSWFNYFFFFEIIIFHFLE